MNRLATTLAVALLGLLLLPALASAAETYVVDTLEDSSEPTCDVPGECTLRRAILDANGDAEESTIEFSVAGEIEPFGSLPAIESRVTIDATTAPGYSGTPVVELDGADEGFLQTGLRLESDGSLIEGLAIHHFITGIRIEGDRNRLCANYLGIGANGELLENEVGVEIPFNTPEFEANDIGAECAVGNVISGNEWFGVVDNGANTWVKGNLIGTGPDGAEPIPNGEFPRASEPSGGILAGGDGTLIGGGSGDGNTIAFNESAFRFGGGIVIASPTVEIRGNSIFRNVEKGIYFRFPIESPPVPALGATASVEGDSTIVSGAIAGGPEETYEVDVFANAVCDEYETGPDEFIQAGEGERYLGSATVKTNDLGAGKFEATVPVQAAGTILTATATAPETDSAPPSTSEFSECIVAPQPTPAPPKPKQTVATAVFLAPPAVPPPPVNGESVAVAPAAGTIKIKVPGQNKFKVLQDGQTIPVGSIIDATKGKVTLTSVNAAGEEQTAVFYGGVFRVEQHEGSGLVVLKLQGKLKGCGGAKASGSTATASASSGRRLWGSGKGKFRTEGNYGSATVRGTVWLTEDRCTGTFFKVRRGVVTVRDFLSNTTFALPAGKTYLAEK